MIIYKDKLSNDELFSDTFPVKVLHDDILYEVQGKMTIQSNDVDESNFGFNASAEEASEQMDSNSTSGIDVVLNHKLQSTSFGDKKEYVKTSLGPYVKKIKNLLIESGDEERAAKFEKDAGKVVKEFILPKFKDFEFYTGEAMDNDAMVILCEWRDITNKKGETEEAPFLYFFKDGIDAEKV